VRFVNEHCLLLCVRRFFDVVDHEAGKGEGHKEQNPRRELEGKD
jgi:hypothetical protein